MTDPSPPTILLTGFDPFGTDSTNPSWLAVQVLAGELIAGHRIACAQLPTSFARAPRVLRAAIRKHRPALVICVGLAASRASISLERVAINIIDARIPDNDGAQPIDIPIQRKGPTACFTTLPIKAMLAKLRDAGIPVEISQTAGTFVCNQVFYALMRTLSKCDAKTRPRGGFIHVPPLSETMPLDTLVAGLRIAIETASTTEADDRIGAGATD